MKINKKVKKNLLEFGVFAGIIVTLFLTGLHTEVFGFLQRGVLETGVMNPDVKKKAASENPEALPKASLNMELINSQGEKVNMEQFRGKVIFINLWATWCPPCRREMPVLERAQSAYPDVSFVLVNQGEDAATIEKFLIDEGLELSDILRDPHSRTMAETGARALPTTLYFAADGSLAETHLGELTGASLAHTLRRRFGAHPLSDSLE